MTSFRTDRNNNPTAFIVELAYRAGLVEGVDYVAGEPFESFGITYVTAKLIGDPLEITIRVIDRLGFYTAKPFRGRWDYIAIPYKLWLSLTQQQKAYVIGYMYECEGGTEMKDLFPQTPEPTPINLSISDTLKFQEKMS